jgi:hypothetical protein
MNIRTKFEAPALDTLHFMRIDSYRFDITRDAFSSLKRSLLDPGYLLSPNTSLIMNSHLPTAILITLLTKSHKITRATLRFDDRESAQAVLGRLAGFSNENDAHPAENEILCPRLSELRLDFGWKRSDPQASKEWLLDALKSRKGAGFVRPLSIYAGWKGEGTYVLLMGS